MANIDTIRPLALAAVQRWHEEYAAEVLDWYENGDGRAPNWRYDEHGNRWNEGGQGHTFPHCIHGTSRWVDYDCACGPCEESLTIEEEAEALAIRTLATHDDRTRWVRHAPADAPIDHETLIKWAFQPITDLFPKED